MHKRADTCRVFKMSQGSALRCVLAEGLNELSYQLSRSSFKLMCISVVQQLCLEPQEKTLRRLIGTTDLEL